MNQNKTEIFQELIKHEPNFLDRPIEELLPMRFMGEVAVNAYRGLIKNLDNLPLAQEDRDAKLKDGQDAGKALLMIEGRIGELFKAIPSRVKVDGSSTTEKEKIAGPLKETKARQFRWATEIADHPEEVAEVIKEAEENEDIPTKTAVLNKIAYKREKDRSKGKREKTKIEMTGAAFLYMTKLEEALRIIPVQPPSDLMERDFLQIKAIALLIINRLKEFQNGKKPESLPASD